jgi:hypothetical protein
LFDPRVNAFLFASGQGNKSEQGKEQEPFRAGFKGSNAIFHIVLLKLGYSINLKLKIYYKKTTVDGNDSGINRMFCYQEGNGLKAGKWAGLKREPG